MRRFGSRVTIIQRGPRSMLDREDPDMAEAVLEADEGRRHRHSAQAEAVEVAGRSGDGVSISPLAGQPDEPGGLRHSGGRRPDAQHRSHRPGQGGRRARLPQRLHPRQRAAANQRPRAFGPWATAPAAPTSRTSARTISASCSSNLEGGNRTTRGRLVPYCLFIDPELAHVGLSETEAKGQGVAYRLIKFPMSGVLRNAHAVRNARLCQGIDRRRRSHSRLYRLWRRGQRDDGRRPDRDDRPAALHGLARRDLHASDRRRRLDRHVFEFAHRAGRKVDQCLAVAAAAPLRLGFKPRQPASDRAFHFHSG